MRQPASGSTPATTALPPTEAIPRASASSSSGPDCARVASDEDPAAAAPECRRTAETLDELRGDLFADYATDPVRAEVLSRQLALTAY